MSKPRETVFYCIIIVAGSLLLAHKLILYETKSSIWKCLWTSNKLECELCTKRSVITCDELFIAHAQQ